MHLGGTGLLATPRTPLLTRTLLFVLLHSQQIILLGGTSITMNEKTRGNVRRGGIINNFILEDTSI